MHETTFEVTSENFQAQVLQSTLPVLVEFGADWCPPCKMLEPLVENIARKYQDKMLVGTLNTDHFPDLAERYDVFGVPTLILFLKGQPVQRLVGFRPQERIERELLQHIQLQSA